MAGGLSAPQLSLSSSAGLGSPDPSFLRLRTCSVPELTRLPGTADRKDSGEKDNDMPGHGFAITEGSVRHCRTGDRAR